MSVTKEQRLATRLEQFVVDKQRLSIEHPLRYLFWEATLRCNLSCRHCGSDCRRDDLSRDRELSPGRVMAQLSAIADVYDPRDITLAIIGGEPLIRHDIEQVGHHAAGLGYSWGITTNGMLLNAVRLASLKAAGLSTISVSLDGLAAQHDVLRQCVGGFLQVSKALELLVSDPFYRDFDVICCVSRLNIDHLRPFVDHLVGMGVPRIRFTPVFSRGRAGRESDLMLEGAQYRQLLEFVADCRRNRSDILVTLSEEGYWGPNWECRVRDSFHYCGSGTVVASILHDGQVTGCPSVSRQFVEGSILQTPFLDIWNNGFDCFRQDRRKIAPKACQRCEHWILCEGGGFHLFEPEDNSVPHCSLRKIGEKKEPQHE